MIKNIVFDFGGVIVDIDRDKAVQAFIKLGLADADISSQLRYELSALHLPPEP